ncbi:hypothetical protein QFC21_005246 [Naganishia friedmannii]|uniref:Uncharacterized protein n=1 Tax=Naganishia friedmannii TaxID=89922 RepID=A0ACC2VB75_9TREE|nr:hypothetical protein QFC21_005246 [Naganishia friedmannii]
MPVNLFPAPYSRIQQAPIIISPTPASHALPHLRGSLGMGMAHPHPAMSTAMMPDAAALGLSMHMPSQSVRVPGAVLTNGVANPYMQHNSLASAGPAYPYNASIYSDLPDQREQQQTHYMRSIPRSQEFGKFDSGIYAYAGGMPDTRTAGNPRPSVYQNYGYPAVGITGGHVMAPTATGYASTIYPDSPTIDTRDSGTRRVKDCSACRAQRLQEQINLVDEIACDCHDSRNRHRRSREPRIRNTKPSFTDSSSDADAEDMSYFSSSGEQRRRRGDSEPRQLAESEIPQRSRQQTSQSGTRNASRAPRLPSLAQLSFDNQRPRTSEPLLAQLRRSGVARPDRLPEDSGARILHYRSHKSSPSRHGCLEDEFQLLQPDDLRMSNLHLRDLSGVHEKSHRRKARSPIVVKATRPPSTMAMGPQS